MMTIWERMSEVAGAVSAGGRSLWSALSTGSSPPTTGDVRKAETGVAFTIAVVALSAKMAKADGVVLGVEKDAFHRAFQVADADRASVDRVFALAQADISGFESYADQVVASLQHDPRLLADVLDSLFHIATADRALHPGEDAFLAEVARRFGMSETTFRHHRANFVVDDSSPYDVLGLTPSASNEEVKTRHRKLVRENHPDLFIARGLPPEAIALATRRLAAINDAYRAIGKDRGL